MTSFFGDSASAVCGDGARSAGESCDGKDGVVLLDFPLTSVH